MNQILKMNIKTLGGTKPFEIVKKMGWSGVVRSAVFDANNHFMGFITLNGNSKQRRHQLRVSLRDLNQ